MECATQLIARALRLIELEEGVGVGGAERVGDRMGEKRETSGKKKQRRSGRERRPIEGEER